MGVATITKEGFAFCLRVFWISFYHVMVTIEHMKPTLSIKLRHKPEGITMGINN